MAGSYVFANQDLSKLSDGQIDELIGTVGRLYGARKDVPGEAEDIQNYLSALGSERDKRKFMTQEQTNKSEIDKILNQGMAGQADSEARSRQSLEDVFNTGRESGTNAINDVFANERGRTIDEAANSGLLRSPGFLTKTLADVDARKTNALKDLFLGLEGQRATGKLGLEDTLFTRGTAQQGLNLQKAGLVQGGQQFGQTFGLNRDVFGEQKRKSAMDDIFQRQALDQAEVVGREQANAAKPTFLDQFSKVTGGLGSLLGGIGSLTKPKKAVV